MSESLRDIFVELGLEVDEKAFSTMDKVLEGLIHGAHGLVTAIAGVGVGLLAAAGFTAETSEHVENLSASLGVSTDELQRLAYAAKFGGVGMDEMGRAMKTLAKHGVKDVRGELLRLADQFSNMPNGGEKTRIALERLGRTGAAMIPVLNKGRKELQELFAEAPVLDKETIEAGVALSHSVLRIQGALKKLTFTIGAPLLEPLGRLAEGIVKWFRANETLIKSKVTAFVEGFASAAKGAFTVLTTAWHGIEAIVDALGGWEPVLTAATIAWVAFSGALMSPIAGLGVLLLLLDDVAGYFDGRDSLTGDAVSAWQKFTKLIFSPGDWQDSAWVSFFKWIGEKIDWLAGKLGTLSGYLGSDQKKVFNPFAAENETDANPNNKSPLGYALHLAGINRQEPVMYTGGTGGAGVVQNQNTLTVNVNGAAAPEVVAQHVGDAIAEHFGIVDEAYRGH